MTPKQLRDEANGPRECDHRGMTEAETDGRGMLTGEFKFVCQKCRRVMYDSKNPLPEEN